MNLWALWMLHENTKTSEKRRERTRVYGQFCVESEAELNANSQTHSYKKTVGASVAS